MLIRSTIVSVNPLFHVILYTLCNFTTIPKYIYLISWTYHTIMISDGDNGALKENKEILDQIGHRKQDPGLFDTVKNTLTTLQQTSERFLMVISGGYLSEIRDKHSPLIQSIKYVMETTIPETTLVILTGSCPASTDNVVVIKENVDCKNPTIPVFTKGN